MSIDNINNNFTNNYTSKTIIPFNNPLNQFFMDTECALKKDTETKKAESNEDENVEQALNNPDFMAGIRDIIELYIKMVPDLNILNKDDKFFKQFIYKDLNNIYKKEKLIKAFAIIFKLTANRKYRYINASKKNRIKYNLKPCFPIYRRPIAYNNKKTYWGNLYWDCIQKRYNFTDVQIDYILEISRFFNFFKFTLGIKNKLMSSLELNEFCDFRWDRIAKTLSLTEAKLFIRNIQYNEYNTFTEKLVKANAPFETINLPGINYGSYRDKSKTWKEYPIHFDEKYEKYDKKEFNSMAGFSNDIIKSMKFINKNIPKELKYRRNFGIDDSSYGRLYGFLNSMKKADRYAICRAYNLVELDFDSFNLNCIYLQITGKKYDGDIYNDILAKLNLPKKHRSMIKIFAVAILSTNKKSTVEAVITGELREKNLYYKFKELNITYKTIINAIEEVCWEIKEYLYCNSTGILQNIESNITIKLAKEMIKDGFPPWLIHDGFIIPLAYMDKYKILMEKLLKEEIESQGYRLNIAIEENKYKRVIHYLDLKKELDNIHRVEIRLIKNRKKCQPEIHGERVKEGINRIVINTRMMEDMSDYANVKLEENPTDFLKKQYEENQKEFMENYERYLEENIEIKKILKTKTEEFKERVRHSGDSLFSILFLVPLTVRVAYFIKKRNLNITPNQISLTRLFILSPIIIFLLLLAPILNLRILYLIIAILF